MGGCGEADLINKGLPVADSIACPTCGKRFRSKPELIGRKVHCPGCGESFIAGLEPSYDLAPAAEPTSPPMMQPQTTFRATSAKAARSRNGTDEQRELARSQTVFVGRHLSINGAVGALIVWFGLQRYQTYRNLGLTGSLVCLALGITMLSLANSESGISFLTRIANYGARVIKAIAMVFLLLLALVIGGGFLLAYGSHSQPSSSSRSIAPGGWSPTAGKPHIVPH
jgi:hypothetical protein